MWDNSALHRCNSGGAPPVALFAAGNQIQSAGRPGRNTERVGSGKQEPGQPAPTRIWCWMSSWLRRHSDARSTVRGWHPPDAMQWSKISAGENNQRTAAARVFLRSRAPRTMARSSVFWVVCSVPPALSSFLPQFCWAIIAPAQSTVEEERQMKNRSAIRGCAVWSLQCAVCTVLPGDELCSLVWNLLLGFYINVLDY